MRTFLYGVDRTMKVMLTESIEKSQQGLAFSGSTVCPFSAHFYLSYFSKLFFVQIAFRMGQIIGQSMGGLLAHPERNFKIFDTPFWREYPFALPCFIASALAIVGVVFAYFFTEEVRKSFRLRGIKTLIASLRLYLLCARGKDQVIMELCLQPSPEPQL